MTIDNYQTHYQQWRWQVPRHFNIAEACVLRWAREAAAAEKIAIIWEDESGETASITYAQLACKSMQFANALRGLGVKTGH